MFTGLVAGTGTIIELERDDHDLRLRVDAGDLGFEDLEAGESIAVNGCCLTALDPGESRFSADVSAESLAHTTLGDLAAGSTVNLERSLTPTTRMGGHFVSGHVDGTAVCVDIRPEGQSRRFLFEVPGELRRYIARKGSVALDGISLTVNAVRDRQFDVNIIPHTLERTNLGQCEPGTRVNLEVDLVARYLERLMGLDGRDAAGGLSDDLLARK